EFIFGQVHHPLLVVELVALPDLPEAELVRPGEDRRIELAEGAPERFGLRALRPGAQRAAAGRDLARSLAGVHAGSMSKSRLAYDSGVAVPTTMQAWSVAELGAPADVLRRVELPVPEPEEGELLIAVAATALNF